VLSHEAISTVIPGIRTSQQVRANTTGIFQLEEKDLQIIEKGLAADAAQLMDEIEKLG
jgi:predicted aldo/keto reductase-like oxidoreductase